MGEAVHGTMQPTESMGGNTVTSVSSSVVTEESEQPVDPGPRRSVVRRARRTVLIAAGTVLALAGSLGTAAAVSPGASSGPLSDPRQATEGPLRADGIWQTDGYGLILAVGGGVLRAWETTAVSCQPSVTARQKGAPGPGGAVRFDADGFDLTVRAQSSVRGSFNVDSSVGTIGLRRLAALPTLCGQTPQTGPVATFDVFWQTFKENYAFFARRGLDWDAVRAEYRPKVHAGTTPHELFDILSEMTAPLHDAHVFLEAATPELTRSFRTARPGTVDPSQEYDDRIRAFIERRNFDGKPLRSYAQGAFGYADLPGGIGYLRINRFVAYTPGGPGYEADSAEVDRVLDQIITQRRTSGSGAWRGLIVDIRVNAGGTDPIGLQIAARFTDRAYTAFGKQARNDPREDTRFTPRQKLTVVPAAGKPRYTGPIALLTGGSTVSAGETFTMALSGRASPTTRIGENTQGILSDTLGRSLPNGWKFGLSNEKYTNPRGISFEGPGIPPHLRTPVFTKEEFAADRDSAFDRAKALFSRRS